MEDAGLREPRVGDTRPAPDGKPRIGDSRPAPDPARADAATGDPARGEGDAGSTPGTGPKRRRRRGGRGRSRSATGAPGTGDGSARAAGGASSGRTDTGDFVTSAFGPEDGSVLDDLDDETLERRRGRTRKGRPTGRYQMVVQVD